MSGDEEVPISPQAPLLTHKHMREALSIMDGARQSIALLEDFFAIELPRFIFFSLLFSVGLVLAYIAPLLLEDALRRAGAARHYAWVVRQITCLVLVIGSLALSLLAVGVSLAQYVVAFGLIGTAIVITLQPIFGAVASGLWAQAFDVIENERRIEVNGYRGTIVGTNLAFVTMRLEETDEILYLPNQWFSVSQYAVRRIEPRLRGGTLDALSVNSRGSSSDKQS